MSDAGSNGPAVSADSSFGNISLASSDDYQDEIQKKVDESLELIEKYDEQVVAMAHEFDALFGTENLRSKQLERLKSVNSRYQAGLVERDAQVAIMEQIRKSLTELDDAGEDDMGKDDMGEADAGDGVPPAVLDILSSSEKPGPDMVAMALAIILAEYGNFDAARDHSVGIRRVLLNKEYRLFRQDMRKCLITMMAQEKKRESLIDEQIAKITALEEIVATLKKTDDEKQLAIETKEGEMQILENQRDRTMAELDTLKEKVERTTTAQQEEMAKLSLHIKGYKISARGFQSRETKLKESVTALEHRLAEANRYWSEATKRCSLFSQALRTVVLAHRTIASERDASDAKFALSKNAFQGQLAEANRRESEIVKRCLLFSQALRTAVSAYRMIASERDASDAEFALAKNALQGQLAEANQRDSETFKRCSLFSQALRALVLTLRKRTSEGSASAMEFAIEKKTLQDQLAEANRRESEVIKRCLLFTRALRTLAITLKRRTSERDASVTESALAKTILQDQLVTAQQQVEGKAATVRKLKNRALALQSDTSSLQLELRVNLGNVKTLLSVLESRERDFIALETMSQQKDSTISTLEHNVTMKDEEISNLGSELEERQTTIESLQRDVQSRDEAVATQKSKAETAAAEATATEARWETECNDQRSSTCQVMAKSLAQSSQTAPRNSVYWLGIAEELLRPCQEVTVLPVRMPRTQLDLRSHGDSTDEALFRYHQRSDVSTLVYQLFVILKENLTMVVMLELAACIEERFPDIWALLGHDSVRDLLMKKVLAAGDQLVSQLTSNIDRLAEGDATLSNILPIGPGNFLVSTMESDWILHMDLGCKVVHLIAKLQFEINEDPALSFSYDWYELPANGKSGMAFRCKVNSPEGMWFCQYIKPRIWPGPKLKKFMEEEQQDVMRMILEGRNFPGL